VTSPSFLWLMKTLPLVQAVQNNKLGAVGAALADRRAQFLAQTWRSEGGSGKTLLALALESRHLNAPKIAALLLPHSDLSATDLAGDTHLIIAARSWRHTMVEQMIPLSDTLAANASGETALMAAARFKHASNVALLLPVSDPMAANADGNTALMLAADFFSDTEDDFVNIPAARQIFDLLLPLSDARVKNKTDADVFDIALHCQNFHAIECLASIASDAQLAGALASLAPFPEQIPLVLPKTLAHHEHRQLKKAAEGACFGHNEMGELDSPPTRRAARSL